MKSLTRMFVALTMLAVLGASAQAKTLYTAPLRAAAGDRFVCHVMRVSATALPEVFVDIIMVNGTGSSLIGGSCVDMGVGDDCDFSYPVTGSLDVYCKIGVTSKR